VCLIWKFMYSSVHKHVHHHQTTICANEIKRFHRIPCWAVFTLISEGHISGPLLSWGTPQGYSRLLLSLFYCLRKEYFGRQAWALGFLFHILVSHLVEVIVHLLAVFINVVAADKCISYITTVKSIYKEPGWKELIFIYLSLIYLQI